MEILNIQSARLSEARKAKKVILTQEVEDGNEPESPIKLNRLENDIDGKIYKDTIDPTIHLIDTKKTEHENAWHTYRGGKSRQKKINNKPS